MQNGFLSAGKQASQTLAYNMKLLAHHELAGFGGIGEGLNMQATRDGRRIVWLAHESAPKNFTGVDVTDPRSPRLVVQTELPHNKVRSNSLDVCGDVMAVAYQVRGGDAPNNPDRIREDLALGPQASRHRSLRCQQAGATPAYFAFRCRGTSFSWSPLPVVRGWRVRPHELGSTGSQAPQSQRPPDLPDRRRSP